MHINASLTRLEHHSAQSCTHRRFYCCTAESQGVRRGGAARAIAEKLNTTAHARQIREMQRI
jgi:hypothetical protein